ncbi:hypothetical protein C8R43DRAFT_1126460 [Mycena crocata]|nr:hypothetical protein C8R43DRAFT_1126460 [Mycena crocata]
MRRTATLSDTARAYTDEEFATLISTLHLSERTRTPSPPPQPFRPEAPPLPSHSGALYYYSSPNGSGYTDSWATAGAETQGVPGAYVYAVKKRSKTRSKKAAYVIFFGRVPCVVLTWREAQPLVTGVSNAIFRGYKTVTQAQAAFAYAQARSWTRTCSSRPSSPSPPPLESLPSPSQPSDLPNPLHGDEALDDTWYVVYSGVRPGVYHSLLEALLNTVGISNSLYESVVGREQAFAQFSTGPTTATAPPQHHKKPSAMKGERYRNMDTLANTTPVQLLATSYDSCCPHRVDASTKKIIFGVGMTDGEAAERAWASINICKPMAREMGPGSRQPLDSLAHTFEAFNLAKKSPID